MVLAGRAATRCQRQRAPARVWLGIQDEALACYDEAGRPLGDYRAPAAAEQARAGAEARATLEARLRAAAELRRRRGEPAGHRD